jgi:predicted amidohydrolase
MKVVTTVVPSTRQGALKANAERVSLARAVIASANADLVVFPAGLLRAGDERAVLKVCEPILEAAKKAKLAVQLGVDTAGFVQRKRAPLPYFLVAWSPHDGARLWRQRAQITIDEVPPEQLAEERVLSIAGQRVAPIACGEIYSQSIRQALADLRPSLATLSAHFAAGSRHWAPQECLQRLVVPSVRSAHASSGTREVLVTRGGSVEPDAVLAVRGVFMNAYGIGGRRKAA